MKLRTKILLLLAAALFAVLMVGLTGVNALMKLSGSIDEIGVVRLPSVLGLEIVNEGQTAIKAQNLSTAIHENNYAAQARFVEVVAARKLIWERIDKGWKIYEPLPQTVEEVKLWKQFLGQWAAWQASVNGDLKLIQFS